MGRAMAGDRRLTPARPDVAARHLQGKIEAGRFADPTPCRLRRDRVILRPRPDPDAAIDTELLFGEPFEVYESTIVGGFVLWSGSDPGFGLIEFEEPEEGVFPMVSDVEISFEITELDSGVQFQFGDATLDEVGESVVLGNSSDLHGHGLSLIHI